jgi:hypothetical protein
MDAVRTSSIPDISDGKTETILSVPAYNWHWQLWYNLANPIDLPQGTKIECTAHFDNSPNNPENPDPTKAVIWGQQSWDEMMVGFFNLRFEAVCLPRKSLRQERCTCTDMFRFGGNSHGGVIRQILALVFAFCFAAQLMAAQEKKARFRVLAIAEHGGIHQPFVDAAKAWLDKLPSENNFAVDYIEDTQKIDDAFLARYSLFIQLNYPPYNWTERSQATFIKYIEQGKGGWIGFHHGHYLALSAAGDEPPAC